MTQSHKDPQQRQRALSRWDNEGGAVATDVQSACLPPLAGAPAPEMANAELVNLHVRVTALENLVIALLATASDRQLKLARDMAAYIVPRPGSVHHPLTTHAATDMICLVERALRFRDDALP